MENGSQSHQPHPSSNPKPIQWCSNQNHPRSIGTIAWKLSCYGLLGSSNLFLLNSYQGALFSKFWILRCSCLKISHDKRCHGLFSSLPKNINSTNHESPINYHYFVGLFWRLPYFPNPKIFQIFLFQNSTWQ